MRPLLVLLAALALAACGSSRVGLTAESAGRVDPELIQLFRTYGGDDRAANDRIEVRDDLVHVVAFPSGDAERLLLDLKSDDVAMERAVFARGVVRGRLPVENIGAAAALPSVRLLRPVYRDEAIATISDGR